MVPGPHHEGVQGGMEVVAEPHRAEIEGRSVEITAPKLGYSVQLTLRELEWLAHQDQVIFSTFLKHPFGPDT